MSSNSIPAPATRDWVGDCALREVPITAVAPEPPPIENEASQNMAMMAVTVKEDQKAILLRIW